MAAKRRRESGQSMIEFAFLVPLVIALLMIMIQVEMAISGAIVNQKYSRAQLHFLSFNARWYPEYRPFMPRNNGGVMRRFWVGVEDSLDHTNVNRAPVAQTFKIGVKKPAGDDAAGDAILNDPKQGRQNVRIRVTAFICTPVPGFKADTPFSVGQMPEEAFLSYPRYCEPGD
jgi:hypothetical protein